MMKHALWFVALIVVCTGCRSQIQPTWEYDGFGSSLAFADFNCDTMTDLAVGAPGADRIDLFTGTSTGLAANPISLYGPTRGASFGGNLVALPDVNGDSCDELLVISGERVEVYRGDASGLHPSPIWINDDQPWLAAAGGDVDEDGLGDVLLGGGGVARLYLGTDTGVSNTQFWEGTQETDGQAYGATVALADIDDDGSLDVVVADPRFDDDQENGTDHGKVYGYRNDQAPDPPRTQDDTLAAGDTDGELTGQILLIADLNDDGNNEMALGFPQWRNQGREGLVRVWRQGILGGNDTTLDGESQDGNFGSALAAVDVDGDDENELVIGVSQFGPASNGELRFITYDEIGTSPVYETITGNAQNRLGQNLAHAVSAPGSSRWYVGSQVLGIDLQGAAAVYSIDGSLPQTPSWTATGR